MEEPKLTLVADSGETPDALTEKLATHFALRMMTASEYRRHGPEEGSLTLWPLQQAESAGEHDLCYVQGDPDLSLEDLAQRPMLPADGSAARLREAVLATFEQKTFQHQRRFARFTHSWEVELHDAKRNRYLRTTTRNLSQVGLFVRCLWDRIDPGTVLDYQILLPEHASPITGEMRVCWQGTGEGNQGVGAEIEELAATKTPAYLQRLYR